MRRPASAPRTAPHHATGSVARLLLGMTLAVALTGCAGGRARLLAPGTERSPAPRLAILPLENISERTDAGDVATQILAARLIEHHDWSVAAPGEVTAALEEMRIRDAGGLSYAQLAELGTRLGTRYLLAGSVLENSTLRTPEGDVPAIGLSLRLLEAASGQVVWTRMKFRSGEDHETLFGWGRVYSAQKLTADLAAELLADLPHPPADSARSGEGK